MSARNEPAEILSPSTSNSAPIGGTGLVRALGPGLAMAIVIGNVIGSGIFAKPGTIAAEAGDFTIILAAWIAGGLSCLLGAFCFAELAAMLPRAGGMYVYLREAYGWPVAFLFGWSDFLFGRPSSIGALSMIFVGALGQVCGWRIGTAGQIAAAVLLIAGLAWINYIGVIWGGRMQGATTAIKAGFLAFIAGLPFLMSLFGYSTVSAANFATTVEPLQTTRAAQFAVALLAVLWAYNGWHDVTPVAEEIRDPQRNMPLALFGGIATIIVLYVGANVAYHAVLPMDRMADKPNREHAAELMMTELLGPAGGTLVSVGVMLSTLGAINSNQLVGPRVSFAMGRDGVFFRRLGHVHPKYRTPSAAIAVQAAMCILLVIASGLLVLFADGFEETTVFDLLSNYVIFSASIFYSLAVLAVPVLRMRHPEWERPYRTFGYPLTPLAYLAFYTWFLHYVYIGKPFEARVGIVLILLGLPVYACYWYWSRRANRQAAG